MDDGDGKHVLPITVRLPLVTITPSILPPTPTPRQPQSQSQVGTQSQGTHFIPAKERKALRKLAVLESQAQSQAQAELKGKSKGKETEKGYRRNDIRVGDTLKVRGRIDEYRRGGEWVRVVVVEPGSGGSVGMSSSSSLHFHIVSHHIFLSSLAESIAHRCYVLVNFRETELMTRGSRSRTTIPPPLDRLRTTLDTILSTIHLAAYEPTQPHAYYSSRPRHHIWDS